MQPGVVSVIVILTSDFLFSNSIISILYIRPKLHKSTGISGSKHCFNTSITYFLPFLPLLIFNLLQLLNVVCGFLYHL